MYMADDMLVMHEGKKSFQDGSPTPKFYHHPVNDYVAALFWSGQTVSRGRIKAGPPAIRLLGKFFP